jgi:hypothetical protein
MKTVISLKFHFGTLFGRSWENISAAHISSRLGKFKG